MCCGQLPQATVSTPWKKLEALTTYQWHLPTEGVQNSTNMFAALPEDSGQLVGTPTIQIHCRSFFAGFHLKLSKCGAGSICRTLMMFMYSKSTVYTPDNPTKSNQPTECPEIRNSPSRLNQYWNLWSSTNWMSWNQNFFNYCNKTPHLKMPNSSRKPIPSTAPNLGRPAGLFSPAWLGDFCRQVACQSSRFFQTWKSCLCIKIRKENISVKYMGDTYMYIYIY